MSRRLRWRNLALGVASAAVVLTVALLILVYGRVGTLRGKTFRIYVTTDAARGVIRGTEVWLDGQKVGLVKNVDFRAASTSTKERLVLSLEMLDVARSHVRADSRVDIRAGGTLIGNQVVYITSGTAKNAVIADGDTLHSGEQSDLESAVSKAAVAVREFPAVMANVKVLAAQLQSAQGTIGAVMGFKGDVKFGAMRAEFPHRAEHRDAPRNVALLSEALEGCRHRCRIGVVAFVDEQDLTAIDRNDVTLPTSLDAPEIGECETGKSDVAADRLDGRQHREGVRHPMRAALRNGEG